MEMELFDGNYVFATFSQPAGGEDDSLWVFCVCLCVCLCV